jgi:hypothetical protein
MKKIFAVAAIATLFAFPGESAQEAIEAVDFLVTTMNSNLTNTSEQFVARIYDPVAIAMARTEIEKEEPPYMIIGGTIVKEPVWWNPMFSYHIDPSTVFFGDFFTEVCDATALYVEEHLEEAGGAFLPNLQWCPWTKQVLEELGNETVIITDVPTMSPSTNETEAPTSPATFGPTKRSAPSSAVAAFSSNSIAFVAFRILITTAVCNFLFV